MKAADLDAIRARVAESANLVEQVPGTVHADRAALLIELDMHWRDAESAHRKIYEFRVVLMQIEDALRLSVGRESCGLCAGDCCRSSDQPVADGLLQLRRIAGPR